MKCDVCEGTATVFLTQIINGQMTTVNLCDACSLAKGVTEQAGFGLAEAFLTGQPLQIGQAEVVCEACGFTAGQLKKIGRMGCPECYTTFRDGLDHLLRAMHKGTRHTGKRPTHAQVPAKPRAKRAPKKEEKELQLIADDVADKINTKSTQAPPSTIAQLRAQLEKAVQEERYEDAAALKIEIDRLAKG